MPSTDVVCVLPLSCQPVAVATTPEDLANRKAAGDLHAWAALTAITDTHAHTHAALAMLRMRALREPAPHAGVRIGKWQSARHLTRARAAARWRASADDPHAGAAWRRFLTEEEPRKAKRKSSQPSWKRGQTPRISRRSCARQPTYSTNSLSYTRAHRPYHSKS